MRNSGNHVVVAVGCSLRLAGVRERLRISFRSAQRLARASADSPAAMTTAVLALAFAAGGGG